MSKEDLVTLEVAVYQETDKALRVYLTDEDIECWIPKSLIHDNSEVYSYSSNPGENEGTLIIPRWFAEKEGLV
jgi:hypothetical protein